MARTLVKRLVAGMLGSAKRTASSSSILRNMIGDRHNAGLFTNLRAHEVMLSDSTRVETYRRAIAHHVTRESIVLDLGTGTGLLAMLAARQGAKKIYALDHSPFIEIAKTIAGSNGIDNIEFVHTNSRAFTPPERVDVILHEQMGTGLFDENMVTNLLDLKQRALKPGGRILPGKFELFMEPVSLNEPYVVPAIDDIRIEGVDLSFLRDWEALDQYRLPDHCWNPHDARVAVDRFLCAPEPYGTFDLNQFDREDQIPTKFSVNRTITADGSLDAYCFYFRANFDEQTGFDTSPLSPYTHWGNRLFRSRSRPCERGDRITYNVAMAPLVDARQWSIEEA